MKNSVEKLEKKCGNQLENSKNAGQATFTFSLIIAIATKCSASAMTPSTPGRSCGDRVKKPVRPHQSPAPSLRGLPLSFTGEHPLTAISSFRSHFLFFFRPHVPLWPPLPTSLDTLTSLLYLRLMGLFLHQPAPLSGSCVYCSFCLSFPDIHLVTPSSSSLYSNVGV